MDNNAQNFQFSVESLDKLFSKEAAQGAENVALPSEEQVESIPKPKQDPGYVEVPDIGSDITEFLVKKEPSPNREEKEQRAEQIGLI